MHSNHPIMYTNCECFHKTRISVSELIFHSSTSSWPFDIRTFQKPSTRNKPVSIINKLTILQMHNILNPHTLFPIQNHHFMLTITDSPFLPTYPLSLATRTRSSAALSSALSMDNSRLERAVKPDFTALVRDWRASRGRDTPNMRKSWVLLNN